MKQALYYSRDHGITTYAKYPYQGKDGACRYDEKKDKVFANSDCTKVTHKLELSLKASLALNPASVSIDGAHLSFQFYEKGVYSGKCGTKLNHGVLAVGYGTLGDKKFWKVKNSWGTDWGMSGYILIENNGDGDGLCGILKDASYPIA